MRRLPQSFIVFGGGVIGCEYASLFNALGVRTTLVSSGPVDTNIWDAVDPDSKPGFTKRKDMLRAEDVAEAVLWAVTRPPKVDVTEIRLQPTIYSPRG